MGKKLTKKKATRPDKPQDLRSKKDATDDKDDLNEKPFDFGGLPNRDLKKNLGCG